MATSSKRPRARPIWSISSGRPTTQERRCVLGRETSIQEAYWGDDDWLYVKNGPVPSLHVEVPGTRDEAKYWAEQRYTLRHGPAHGLPVAAHARNRAHLLHRQDDKLRLFGRESIGSWFEQALVARRQTHFSYDAETVVDFSPTDERSWPASPPITAATISSTWR